MLLLSLSALLYFWTSFLAVLSYLGALKLNAKRGRVASPLDFTPDIYLIFHVIWFFNTTENVAKNNLLWKFFIKL